MTREEIYQLEEAIFTNAYLGKERLAIDNDFWGIWVALKKCYIEENKSLEDSIRKLPPREQLESVLIKRTNAFLNSLIIGSMQNRGIVYKLNETARNAIQREWSSFDKFIEEELQDDERVKDNPRVNELIKFYEAFRKQREQPITFKFKDLQPIAGAESN